MMAVAVFIAPSFAKAVKVHHCPAIKAAKVTVPKAPKLATPKLSAPKVPKMATPKLPTPKMPKLETPKLKPLSECKPPRFKTPKLKPLSECKPPRFKTPKLKPLSECKPPRLPKLPKPHIPPVIVEGWRRGAIHQFYRNCWENGIWYDAHGFAWYSPN